MSLSKILTNTFYENGISSIILDYKREMERFEFIKNLKHLYFLEIMDGSWVDEVNEGNVFSLRQDILHSILLPSTFFKFPYLNEVDFIMNTSHSKTLYYDLLNYLEKPFINNCTIEETDCLINDQKVYRGCFEDFIEFDFIYYNRVGLAGDCIRFVNLHTS